MNRHTKPEICEEITNYNTEMLRSPENIEANKGKKKDGRCRALDFKNGRKWKEFRLKRKDNAKVRTFLQENGRLLS